MYHQIHMRDEDIAKIAFYTHQRHYKYIVMLFGLSNTLVTFQAVMNDIFCLCLEWFMLVFFNDILVYIKDGEDHARQFNTIILLLKTHHLCVNVKKYFLFQAKIEYLSHYISTQGVVIHSSKITLVHNLPLLTL